jgi:TetR/AcrR family transcriptional regulator, mexJK operon transcriptional repressor
MRRSKLINSRRIPRGEKRRMELAAIAERVFLARGFTETTMQMIASQAGGSKETLYRHFRSKEALFAEVIGRRAAQISGPESALARDEIPEVALFDLGISLMRMMTNKNTASLFRVVVAEASRSPTLGAIFYARGPATTLKRLTKYLRAAASRGQLRCREPLRAAKLFIGAVVAQHHLYCLFGQRHAAISVTEMHAHVRGAVSMFLACYRPEGSRSAKRRPPVGILKRAALRNPESAE